MAIRADGSVVSWGHPEFGGDSTGVRNQLRGVQQVASDSVFAAILADGSVVAWGNEEEGGNSFELEDFIDFTDPTAEL